MIDNIYVKKKKKKKTIVLVTSISSFLVSCFVIIALLSSFVGNYTIGVRDFKSRLVLSEKETFEDPSTFIRFDGFRNAVDYSYTMLNGPTRDAYLDNKDNEGPEKGLSPDQNGTYTSSAILSSFLTSVRKVVSIPLICLLPIMLLIEIQAYR